MLLGDLPELLNDIIQYFHHDYKTLHSCILVNRLWCRLSIPLLWEDPFSMKFPKNHNFIKIYLHHLNDDDKTKLNECGISNDIFPSNTLFNYPSFIQCLNTHKIRYFIVKWVATVRTSTTNFVNSNIIAKLIFKSLFILFIENEANLHTFRVSINSYTKYFHDVFELILQNPNFIRNIKNLTIDILIETDYTSKLLVFLYSNCNSISSLDFLIDDYSAQEALKYSLQIIKSQVNLKKILFSFNNFSFYHSLFSNCSNTLNTITFYDIDFKNINVSNEVFELLNVLESIHIIYCYPLNSDFIQQFINFTKPFKLKSLFLREISSSQIESFKLLLQKSGDYLENFGIANRNLQPPLLLESMINYCSKFEFLDLSYTKLNDQNIYSAIGLIKINKQNLNYLSIGIYENENVSSILLQNLGQILPFKLEYLCLNLTIDINDFEIFLKNSQNTFIKKLSIKNGKKEKSKDIFPYIKEYIMKKKRVKYLAILEIFNGKNEDLFSLKDKVKEFKLYDIQVLNHDDLFIRVYDFIKELDY